MTKQKFDGTLGTTSFNVEFLKSVTLKEALEHFKGTEIHEDRVRNAWKRANNKK
jgi:benzoyl-CoA reductase/2-hydroxyglutaryl-CoA dehydratase subunit BcrC/BadD/HgdB